jgi:hypothetical protein
MSVVRRAAVVKFSGMRVAMRDWSSSSPTEEPETSGELETVQNHRSHCGSLTNSMIKR